MELTSSQDNLIPMNLSLSKGNLLEVKLNLRGTEEELSIRQLESLLLKDPTLVSP